MHSARSLSPHETQLPPTEQAISRMPEFRNPALPGVVVFGMTERIVAGEKQQVLVRLEPGATIPLHTHSVDATMTITAGRAIVLSSQAELQGRVVTVGDVVRFVADIPHGFQADETGLAFVSSNGGIVDEDSNSWDMQFAA